MTDTESSKQSDQTNENDDYYKHVIDKDSNNNSDDYDNPDSTTTNTDCSEPNYDVLSKPNKEFIRKDGTISSTTSRDLYFCIQTVLKQAVKEDNLVDQLFYTMLSAYTNNPINLAINASSGVGKSYVLRMVGNLFPEKDVSFVTDMSDKAMFHKSGYIGIKNNDGEYVNIEEELEQLTEEFENLKNKLTSCKTNEKKELLDQVRDIHRRKIELLKNAVKVIDLHRKIIIFLDTPRERIFEGMMTLLSHDKFESEYHYVDTSSKTGIATKTNVLKGWPAVIFAQAIDYTGHPRYHEIQRRFIITNPRMDDEKYDAAVDHILLKSGLPDDVYQQKVVSDKDKESAKEIILNIRDDTLFLSSKTKPGKNNILIPFLPLVKQILSSKKITVQEMNFADRLMNLVGLFTIINHKKRPYIEVKPAFGSESIIIPVSTYSDLKEAFSLINHAPAGIRPYVWDWYQNVFLELYQSKRESNSKITPTRGEVIEERIAVTTAGLIEKTMAVMNKICTTKSIQPEFIQPLTNLGYIDSIQSEIDRRANIYFPVYQLDEKNSNLFHLSNKNNLFEENNEKDQNSSTDKDKTLIISNIKEIMRYYSENGNLVSIKYAFDHRDSSDEDNDEYTSVEQIVEKYYSDLISSSKENNDKINYDRRVDVDIYHNKSPIKIIPVSEEYSQKPENNNVLQEKVQDDINNSSNDLELSNNLFHNPKKNKLLYSCYIIGCNFQTFSELEYQKHYVLNHPNKPAYPSSADIQKDGLKPQGKPWE